MHVACTVLKHPAPLQNLHGLTCSTIVFRSTPDYATPVDQQFHVDYDLGGELEHHKPPMGCIWDESFMGCLMHTNASQCMFVYHAPWSSMMSASGSTTWLHMRLSSQHAKTTIRRADHQPSHRCGTLNGPVMRQVWEGAGLEHVRSGRLGGLPHVRIV